MNNSTTVLVTGSHGFIGRHLVNYLAARGYSVRAASKSDFRFDGTNVVSVELGDLRQPFDWRPLLTKCDAVVHLAGIAHTNADPGLYDLVNHQATASLANSAADCGVHMIFMSSIAAQSGSFVEHELTETDPASPDSAYGRSKLAAEQAVRAAGDNYTILRPVAVYGDGAKGNFATLNALARLRIPLPLGGLTATRSILSVENLASAVELVLTDPRARGETFIVSDPEPLPIPEIIARSRRRLGRPSWLIRVPENWLETVLKTVGRGSVWQQIGRSLIARPRKLVALGWKPVE
jgi:nucleoside-diphosphate-sugar epimerase